MSEISTMCSFSRALIVSSLLCLADRARMPMERFFRPGVVVDLPSCDPGILKSLLLILAEYGIEV